MQYAKLAAPTATVLGNNLMGEVEMLNWVSGIHILTVSLSMIANPQQGIDIRAEKGQTFLKKIAKEIGPISPFRVTCAQAHRWSKDFPLASEKKTLLKPTDLPSKRQ